MPFKVTLMYNLVSGGAKRPGCTESYLYLGAAASLDTPILHTDSKAFMNARTELMGANVSAVGYRVSIPKHRPRRSMLVLVNTDDGAGLNPVPIQTQGSADPGTTSVVCAGY